MGELKSTLLNLKSILVELNDTLQRILSSEPYTRYEKLEITSIYAESSTVPRWTITINVKNTGSANALIDNILLNGKPCTQIDGVDVTWLPLYLPGGKERTITITIAKGDSFASGVSVEVRLHSASGRECPKTVSLP